MDKNQLVGRRQILGCLGAIGVQSALPALAQSDYPNRPIRIVLGLPAGGAADIVVRALAQELELQLLRPFAVEFRRLLRARTRLLQLGHCSRSGRHAHGGARGRGPGRPSPRSRPPMPAGRRGTWPPGSPGACAGSPQGTTSPPSTRPGCDSRTGLPHPKDPLPTDQRLCRSNRGRQIHAFSLPYQRF